MPPTGREPRSVAHASIDSRWAGRLHYSCGTVTARPRFLALALLVTLAAGACGGQGEATSGPSAGGATPAGTAAPSAAAGASPVPTTIVPTATPAATPLLNPGFRFADILRVQVNSLAARIAPKRTAALVHAYDISGPAPVDGGSVRLDKGDFVSVELGPVPVGDTVWYLVWPAAGAKLHPSGLEWYMTPPMAGQPGPAWMAASVGGDVYLKLERHPTAAEIEAFGPPGVMAAGRGSYVSEPQPRHDAFQLGWAAATPSSGTSCKIKITLVPADADFAPKVALETSTTSVKVSPLEAVNVGAPWLPADAGSWTTFTINVTGTCNWAFHLVRLEHD